ncbi:MAG: signal peptidase I [Bacilli bacterium]
MKKTFKIISGIFKFAFVMVLVLFIAVVCLQRFSNNKISFFNYRLFSVITGSMKPMYNVGDVLLSKEVDINTLEKGDVVSYLGKVNDFAGKIVTHQIIDIEKTSDGTRIFHTKGTANQIEDPVIYGNQIYGKVIYKSFILSLIYKIVANKTGMFLLVIIPLMIVIITEIISTLLDKEEKRRKI